ncbi:MAG: hypothetical protein QOH09_265, partial [Pseudonocardiales bacterium]|nr:hypothetical protein [Pseudonocardiales bacterium]
MDGQLPWEMPRGQLTAPWPSDIGHTGL